MVKAIVEITLALSMLFICPFIVYRSIKLKEKDFSINSIRMAALFLTIFGSLILALEHVLSSGDVLSILSSFF